MTTYDVTVTREDDLWVADITGEGLGPAATDVERFADLDTEVRDLIAGLTDADPGSLGLAIRDRRRGCYRAHRLPRGPRGQAPRGDIKPRRKAGLRRGRG